MTLAQAGSDIGPCYGDIEPLHPHALRHDKYLGPTDTRWWLSRLAINWREPISLAACAVTSCHFHMGNLVVTRVPACDRPSRAEMASRGHGRICGRSTGAPNLRWGITSRPESVADPPDTSPNMWVWTGRTPVRPGLRLIRPTASSSFLHCGVLRRLDLRGECKR